MFTYKLSGCGFESRCNCYSDNNNDKIINNDVNDNNDIKSLVFVNNVFFGSCLNVLRLMFLFVEFGNLFQTNSLIYEKLCPNVSFSKRNFKSSVIIS